MLNETLHREQPVQSSSNGSVSGGCSRPVGFVFAKPMIALEVKLNGKRVCIAGAEDLCVLGASVSAVGKLGKKTVPARPDESADLFYSVGGLTSRLPPRANAHVNWQSVTPLKIGDTIEVRIIETNRADRARSRRKAKPQNGEPSGSRQRRVEAQVGKRRPVARRA